MKNIRILFVLLVCLSFTSCTDDFLETAPTDKTSGDVLFSTVEGAQVAMDGMYRALYVSGWSGGNTHQNFGPLSSNMFLELMGEDYLQNEMGNGWFYFDYKYDVRSRYASTSWRSYATWNFYYTLISNANYIIASAENIVGETSVINNIKGQALTMRAYCYFYLVQIFQQTYVGHETAPGVPLYTEPTSSTSEGKARGTVEEVYVQINKDLDEALTYLDPAKSPERADISHVDYYVTSGIQAKVKLVQNKWDEAEKAADNAMGGGTKLITKDELVPADSDKYGSTEYRRTGTFHFNDAGNKSVIWGAKIISDQATSFASYFSHMDSEAAGMYGEKSRKCISNWLYEQVSTSDVRKLFWNPGGLSNADQGPVCSYNQFKFKFLNAADYTGDYIFMRHEEMLLIKAEAQCMQDNYTGARATLTELIDERGDYDLSRYTDSKVLTTTDANGPTTPAGGAVTLLDGIMLQRRIELWGEAGRILDIQRSQTGFTRTFTGSNHSAKLANINTDVASKEFILTIPQTEFDGNINMDEQKDQNPL
jgi:hypothetical protein